MGFVITLLMILYLIFGLRTQKIHVLTDEEIAESNQHKLLELAQVAEKKFRYEEKRFQTRIFETMKRCFNEVRILENLAIEVDGEVYTIPMVGITEKGIILFQLVDYPGRVLIGDVTNKKWNLAQSERCAQEIPNAIWQSMDTAMAIKGLTAIDLKPIVVISKYTPTCSQLTDNLVGQRVIQEEHLEQELMSMRKYGKQTLPAVYMEQAKARLVELNDITRT